MLDLLSKAGVMVKLGKDIILNHAFNKNPTLYSATRRPGSSGKANELSLFFKLCLSNILSQ